MDAPEKIEIIGDFLALRWKDGRELIFDSLPCGQILQVPNKLESDIFGEVSEFRTKGISRSKHQKI